VAPKSISTGTIYRGVVPFVIIQLAVLAFVYAFPKTATWLPDYLFRTPAAVEAPADPATGGETAPEGEGGATFDLDGGSAEGEGGSGGAFDLDGGAPEGEGGSGGAFDLDGGKPETEGGG